jgi:hypothetical protein
MASMGRTSLLTGEDAEIRFMQDGAKQLNKKLQPAGLSIPLPVRLTIRRVSKQGDVFHNLAATTTGKNLPEEFYRF